MFRNLILFALSTGAAMAVEADFGLIAVAAFETARLNATCDGSVSVCDVTFEFHDESGRLLKQQDMRIQPGATGFVEISGPRAGLIDPCFKVGAGAAFASVEVFDVVTQRTRLLVHWGDRPMARSGDIDFGAAAITPFDVGRISATCMPGDGSVTPAPCEVTFEFHDAQGGLVKQSTMTIQPGASGFLNLRWSEINQGRTVARRVTIDPCFKVGRGAAVGAFALVDGSGLTLAHSYPAALIAARQ